MKRGLIVWDESELPRSALEGRLDGARAAATSKDVSAIVVYTDVWRSNHARTLVNFMPYWGRSLLVVPASGGPLLLCGNSPRVYPWLSTVTFVDELRATKDFAAGLVELAAERGWKRIGVLSRAELPHDIEAGLAASALELVDVEPWERLEAIDAEELVMRRTAIALAREIVDRATQRADIGTERDVAAALERSLRRAGMEDVLIRLAPADAPPGLASELPVTASTSVLVACEYRGHWVQLSRPFSETPTARAAFVAALSHLADFAGRRYDLSGPFPYRALAPSSRLEPGRLVALHLQTDAGTLYGDTCRVTGATGGELL